MLTRSLKVLAKLDVLFITIPLSPRRFPLRRHSRPPRRLRPQRIRPLRASARSNLPILHRRLHRPSGRLRAKRQQRSLRVLPVRQRRRVRSRVQRLLSQQVVGLWRLLGLLRLQFPGGVPLLLALLGGHGEDQEGLQSGREEAEEDGTGAE